MTFSVLRYVHGMGTGCVRYQTLLIGIFLETFVMLA